MDLQSRDYYTMGRESNVIREYREEAKRSYYVNSISEFIEARLVDCQENQKEKKRKELLNRCIEEILVVEREAWDSFHESVKGADGKDGSAPSFGWTFTKEQVNSWLTVYPEGVVCLFEESAQSQGETRDKVVGYAAMQRCHFNPTDLGHHKDFYVVTDGGSHLNTHTPDSECLYGTSIALLERVRGRLGAKLILHILNHHLQDPTIKYFATVCRMPGLSTFIKSPHPLENPSYYRSLKEEFGVTDIAQMYREAEKLHIPRARDIPFAQLIALVKEELIKNLDIDIKVERFKSLRNEEKEKVYAQLVLSGKIKDPVMSFFANIAQKFNGKFGQVLDNFINDKESAHCGALFYIENPNYHSSEN